MPSTILGHHAASRRLTWGLVEDGRGTFLTSLVRLHRPSESCDAFLSTAPTTTVRSTRRLAPRDSEPLVDGICASREWMVTAGKRPYPYSLGGKRKRALTLGVSQPAVSPGVVYEQISCCSDQLIGVKLNSGTRLTSDIQINRKVKCSFQRCE